MFLKLFSFPFPFPFPYCAFVSFSSEIPLRGQLDCLFDSLLLWGPEREADHMQHSHVHGIANGCNTASSVDLARSVLCHRAIIGSIVIAYEHEYTR